MTISPQQKFGKCKCILLCEYLRLSSQEKRQQQSVFVSFTFCSFIKHKVQLRLMGMSIVLQIFDDKPKYWTNINLDLMMALEGKSEDQSYYNSS